MFMYNGVWVFVVCHNVYLAIGICSVFSLTAKHKQRESIKKSASVITYRIRQANSRC
jgi:hypothetical protein